MANVNGVHLDPEYVQFLLNPDLGFSCYFVVGNEELAPVEKIGVVRKMLAAHSEVFRSQLLDKKWKSEEPETINDIFPATFKNLLRFVYGHDTTATMSFDDADDLFYVAERYIMPRLKNKLATRLMSLLDFTNICSLLTNPACARELELQSEINKVIQLQTDKILAHPQFLNCCPETFVKILEQEALSVSEVELWRAALKWARKRVESENPGSLRHQLEKPLQHLRMCAMPLDTYLAEVAPTGILMEEETAWIAGTRLTGEKPAALAAICGKTNPRRMYEPCSKFHGNWYFRSEEQLEDLKTFRIMSLSRLTFSLKTLDVPVMIVTLVCSALDRGEYNFTATIQAVGSTESVVAHSTHLTGGPADLPISVSTNERDVVLSANTKYKVTISCDRSYYPLCQIRRVDRREHFRLIYPRMGFWRTDEGDFELIGSPVAFIHYKTLTPR